MKNRRLLIAALGTLGTAALHAPLASFAQTPPTPAGAPGKIWRVGMLTLLGRPALFDAHFFTGGILRGLRDFGYVEGKNLVIEWRFAENQVTRLPAMAAQLLQWKPDVLVATGDAASLEFKKATATIPALPALAALPIVSAATSDPVSIGLITSLARPGGNVTGVTSLTSDLAPKQLELLLAMVAAKVPKVTRVAVLMNPEVGSHHIRLKSTEAAAKILGVSIVPVEARDAAQIDAAFTKMRGQNAGALLVFLNPLFQQRSAQIAELAAKFRLPSMTGASVYPDAGCLMSYGTNLYEQFRRGAYFVDRILKGAKPADLPFEQPTKFELVINGRVAKALGLKIPHALLISAERVIE